MSNPVKEKINNNQVVSGCFIGMYSTYLAEVAGHMGFDFIVIDNEHGAFSWEQVEEMIRAVETTPAVPFVRVPSSNPVYILKALDRGAKGIQVPKVESEEEAEQVIKSVKFPPEGERGVAYSVRASKYGLDGGPEYLKRSNDDIFITIQLETPKGIQNVEKIIAKDIDMIYIGPTDLSVSANRASDGVNHPEVIELIEKVFDSGKTINKNVRIHVANSNEWHERKKRGAKYIGIAINSIINPALSQ